MDARLLVVKFWERVRQVGLRATLSQAFGSHSLRTLLGRAERPDAFDTKYGTDTGRSVPLWQLDLQSENAAFGVKYQTSEEEETRETLNCLGEDVRSFTFVDLGCGKGRALLIAAQMGFRQVIGVEFSKDLAAIAQANLAKMQVGGAVVALADAAEYQLPDCDNLLVYLYNPFSKPVMEKVIDQLRASRAKRLFVIYKYPSCADLFDEAGFLTPLGGAPGNQPIRIWSRITS
jgi:SAM-dependent methyltransferase